MSLYIPKRQLGFIKRFMSTPCDVAPSIWVETGIDAALHVIFDFVSFDPREAYHDIIGETAVCSLKGIVQDIPNVPNPSESKATRFFFSGAELFERSSWYAFLFDLAYDGAINWVSQAIHVAGCGDSTNPNVGQGTFYFGAIHDDGRWNGLDFQFQPSSKFYPVSPSTVSVRNNHYWAMAATVSWADFFGVPLTCETRIHCTEDGTVYDTWGKGVEQDGERRRSIAFYKGQNRAGAVRHYSQEWSYNGPPLPYGQAFPDPGGHCYMYSPD